MGRPKSLTQPYLLNGFVIYERPLFVSIPLRTKIFEFKKKLFSDWDDIAGLGKSFTLTLSLSVIFHGHTISSKFPICRICQKNDTGSRGVSVSDAIPTSRLLKTN